MEQKDFPIDAETLLTNYDHGQLRFAMAYGSGVVRQQGYKGDEKPMMDFVFAVDNPHAWHRANMEAHPEDYSFLSRFGADAIHTVQELGTGVYYHPYVRHQEHEIKYGVIDTRRLIGDLTGWKDLYIAGRMHKPVHVLRTDSTIDTSQQKNVQGAIDAARLMLPETFSEEGLYRAIAGISYAGDVRMGVGENPHKVENIVAGSFERFRSLYGDALASTTSLTRLQEGIIAQDTSPETVESLVDGLPEHLRVQLQQQHASDQSTMPERIRRGLRKIVGQSSLIMTLKGLLTAGPMRSMRYLREKIGKRFSR